VGVIIFMPFERQLDRSAFSCGNQVLDHWFREQCGQQDGRNTARTTFGVDEAQARIASFYSLVTFRVEAYELVGTALERRRRYPMSAILIAKLAVDLRYQRQGLGALTLGHALHVLAGASSTIGFECVIVDAIDEYATRFYLRHGFTRLADDGRRLFLRTDDLRASVTAAEA
jgi:GNAT superfamily N-acetyltransferase